MSVNIAAMVKDFKNCLTQQMTEFELLKCMYPNSGEIILSDKKIIDDINDFINDKSIYIPDNLDFILNIIINNLRLEVRIDLPSSYPKDVPDIYISCNQLNGQQESSLNKDLNNFVKNNHIGEVCLYTAISWLQENIDIYDTLKDTNTKVLDQSNKPNSQEKFLRMWIYSHHIYNKKKRQEICKKSADFNLSGFCLPGKPGIICVEGPEEACKKWWKIIKSMNWQKIVIRETKNFELSEQSIHKKFSYFEEINFRCPDNTRHNNMSTFSKYMSDHGCSQIFNNLFGISSQ